MLQQIAFICGCGHTGTSLLANMFAAHPAVFVPRVETRAFFAKDASVAWGNLQAEAVASGLPFLVEKTPTHIHKLDLIRGMVPGARFLLTVRDPRDNIASMAKRYGDPTRALSRWLLDTRAVLKERGLDDVTVIRLEDLVSNTEAEVRRACDHIGIPFDPAMLRYHEHERLWFKETEIRRGNGQEGPEHTALRVWQINQPVFDNRGAWRQVFSESEMDSLITNEVAQIAREFGY